MSNSIHRGLISFVMVCLLTLSAATVAAQEESSVTLDVQDAGVFNVTLCGGGEFAPVGITSSQGAETTTIVTICYEDNSLERDAYTVTLSASNLTLDGVEGGEEIPATNLSVSKTFSPVRYTAEGCTLPPLADGVGLIYAIDGNGLVVAPVDSADQVQTYAWGENSLAQPVTVGAVNPGKGTASCDGSSQGVTADVELTLSVPAGIPEGTYSTDLVVEVPLQAYP